MKTGLVGFRFSIEIGFDPGVEIWADFRGIENADVIECSQAGKHVFRTGDFGI